MRFFVASWYYPPVTSSESIVTYKLLKNSKFEYDVYSSTSQQWSYTVNMEQKDNSNINTFTIQTDSIDEWVKGAIKKFEEQHKDKNYDCIMTRSTPPESILIGQYIKKKYPKIKWIASLADPVANNPYELATYVDACSTLSQKHKEEFKNILKNGNEEQLENWEKRPEIGIRLLCRLKRWQNTVIKNADLIICPTAVQLKYLTGNREWKSNYFVLPHSFDKSFYCKDVSLKKDRTVLSYIGYSDTFRSLEPFVKAIRLLKQKRVPELEKLKMFFIGNHPQFIQDMIINYHLDDIIHVERGVDYYESLRRMQESDWLLHVDAFFAEIETGGSVFFPGKLADYMGAERPILALTGEGSPSDDIVTLYGGTVVRQWEISKIAAEIEKILVGKKQVTLNRAYADRYNAINVAAQFDERIEQMFRLKKDDIRKEWAPVPTICDKKLVTICVPSYNVEHYLDRCLQTLVAYPLAGKTEILVIDDGSTDFTAEIATTYEKQYPGIVRLIQKENGGHGSTINRALQESNGMYFMVVDGDDWICSRQFNNLINDIDLGKVHSDLISSNYVQIDTESSDIEIMEPQVQVTYFKEMLFEELDVEKVYFTLAGSLFKTSVLKQVEKKLQENTFYVDVEYFLFPIPYVKTVTFVNYSIYRYCRGSAEQSVYLPTMVKRYKHHERVMKSVIQYRQDTKMSSAQRQYYDAVLKRLLFTHYALFMVYNDDKEEGFAQGQSFDEFLCNTCPILAKWIAQEMPLVKIARKKHFDYISVQHSLAFHWACLKTTCKCKAKAAIHYIAGWKITNKLIYNRLTIAISKNAIFKKGLGKRIKERLKRYVGI